MVLIKGFLVLKTTYAFLGILLGELLLLELQVSHLVLDVGLTQLLLQLGDHILEGVFLPLGALEDRNVGLEPLVDLLSRGQLCPHLRKLLNLLLIDLNRRLMPF